MGIFDQLPPEEVDKEIEQHKTERNTVLIICVFIALCIAPSFVPNDLGRVVGRFIGLLLCPGLFTLPFLFVKKWYYVFAGIFLITALSILVSNQFHK